MKRPHWTTQAARLLALLILSALALQLYFLLRVAMLSRVDPASSTFQRTQAVRILQRQGDLPWSQAWIDLADMGRHLPRAVLASEDAGFVQHGGLDWEAIERAQERNRQRQGQAERPGRSRLAGGSTITQQLAKNLHLSGERTMLRKAQEAAIALALEAMLDKRRILEIYLNTVEWGEGVYGAQAASRHYYRVDPSRLEPLQAARLAVMLPAPRRFEKLPRSEYLQQRSTVIAERMPGVRMP